MHMCYYITHEAPVKKKYGWRLKMCRFRCDIVPGNRISEAVLRVLPELP
jgi:hypothetical protein